MSCLSIIRNRHGFCSDTGVVLARSLFGFHSHFVLFFVVVRGSRPLVSSVIPTVITATCVSTTAHVLAVSPRSLLAGRRHRLRCSRRRQRGRDGSAATGVVLQPPLISHLSARLAASVLPSWLEPAVQLCSDDAVVAARAADVLDAVRGVLVVVIPAPRITTTTATPPTTTPMPKQVAMQRCTHETIRRHQPHNCTSRRQATHSTKQKPQGVLVSLLMPTMILLTGATLENTSRICSSVV